MSDAPAQEPAAAADAPAGVTLATMRLYCVLQAERIAIVQDHLVKSGLRGAWAPSAAMDVDILNAIVRLLDLVNADAEIRGLLKKRAKPSGP